MARSQAPTAVLALFLRSSQPAGRSSIFTGLQFRIEGSIPGHLQCGLTLLQGLPVESTICLTALPLRSSRTVRGEAALPQRTDCTSTGGLVALVVSAGPDTNRSAGLHSLFVVASRRDTGLVELARRRSDLWMHLRAHVLGKIVVVDSVNPPGPARPWRNPRA